MHQGVSEPALDLRAVSVAYGSRLAVENVCATLDPGEVVALVGPNGAGKSSLMHAVLGIVPSTGGVVVHTHRRGGLAFVPQGREVDVGFPITIEQVVMQGRRPFIRFGRRPKRTDRQAVSRALSTVGLDGLERRALGELSGGQVQRVLFARALAQEADVLLLDEPFSGVDRPTTGALVDLLGAIAQAGMAVLIATHDLALVRERFMRCLLLNRRLAGDGPPDEVLAGPRLEALFAMRE